MEISSLDKKTDGNIVIYKMKDNKNDNLPVYIRKVHQNQLSPLHSHEMLQINYVAKGKLIHRINHSQYELVKGDIFIIPPFIPHQLLEIPNSEFEIVELEFTAGFILGNESVQMQNPNANSSFFDFYYIEPFLVSECNVKPRLNLDGEHQMEAEALLSEIYSEYNRKQDSYLLAIKADVLRLLVLVGRYFHEDVARQPNVMATFDRHRSAITNVIHFIDSHYSESISLKEASRVALLSPSYFSYFFKHMTNKTFIEYLNNKRVKHAMDLLKNTNKLVVNICFESGFKNVNHFNRTFKNTVGLSPTEYRKANRSDYSKLTYKQE